MDRSLKEIQPSISPNPITWTNKTTKSPYYVSAICIKTYERQKMAKMANPVCFLSTKWFSIFQLWKGEEIIAVYEGAATTNTN